MDELEKRMRKALADLANGKMVVVADDKNRENEGDVIMRAASATPEAINFISKYARGLICVAITEKKAEQLSLKQMVSKNTESHHTAFTVSLDAQKNTTTGISAFDMSETITQIADHQTSHGDFRYPGHIFPLVAKNHGVLERRGHTEATIDLIKIATNNNEEAGVLCEILSEDGSMAREKELKSFAQKWNLQYITVAEIEKYRKKTEIIVTKKAKTSQSTHFGTWDMLTYDSLIDEKEHILMQYGKHSQSQNVLVGIHTECILGEIFFSKECSCKEHLGKVMSMVEKEGSGCLIYVREQEQEKSQHACKMQKHDINQENKTEGQGDSQECTIAAHILKEQKIDSIRLLTNNPEKGTQLRQLGIKITKEIPVII